MSKEVKVKCPLCHAIVIPKYGFCTECGVKFVGTEEKVSSDTPLKPADVGGVLPDDISIDTPNTVNIPFTPFASMPGMNGMGAVYTCSVCGLRYVNSGIGCPVCAQNKYNKNRIGEAIKFLQDNKNTKFLPNEVSNLNVTSILYLLNSDNNYMENFKQIKNKAISKLSLEEIRTYYTYILRSEKFSYGSICSYINNGTVLKLFKRHYDLI